MSLKCVHGAGSLLMGILHCIKLLLQRVPAGDITRSKGPVWLSEQC